MKKTNKCFELQAKDAGTKETVAELQARKSQLEAANATFEKKDDALSKAELRANRAEIREIETAIELEAAQGKLSETEKQETERRTKEANFAIEAMRSTGEIAPRDQARADELLKKFVADPSLIPMVAGKALEAAKGKASGATASRQAINPPEPTGSRFEVGFDVKGAMKQFYGLVAQNAKTDWRNPESRMDNYRKKGQLALEAGVFYKKHLAPHLSEWEHMRSEDLAKAVGLEAADYSDPNNSVGVLSGTLVLQRTLPTFAYKYPELLSLYTDFSDTPGLYKQTETTRIVVQPATQLYDATLDSAGRPKGWDTVSAAQTTDVSMTLTDYIAVPIVFGNNILGATTRRLFDEQAGLAMKAIAGYFVNMLTNLVTAGNYNAYATVKADGTVPTAYPTYAKGLGEFAMGDLDAIDAAFTSNKVPEEDRSIFLNPQYYSKLRGDPRLSFMYAASARDTGAAAGEFLTEARLPKLSGFAPYKSPYLPATVGTTANIVGFAFQKAAAVLKSRLPQDFTQALGVMVPGSVTTVTDPDTKISLMLVQYVHLTQGYAEWRPEVMLGASVGDKRAGLVLTSQ